MSVEVNKDNSILQEEKDYLDYLTGIRNRMGLFQIYESLSVGESVGVMFMDVDNFKTINDTYGHKKGDEVLTSVAKLLESNLPMGSFVARLGGDEFAAIVRGDSGRENCIHIAEKILNAIRQLKQIDPAFEIISGSIGIIHNYPAREGLDTALNCADKAMYFAKEQGKNTYVIYADYKEQVDYENQIEKDLQKAILEDRILVKYHPVQHLQSSRIICTEACCLWRTPEAKLIGRNDFRSVLLKSGLIDELDMHVFKIICRDYAALTGKLKKKHPICVQFSHLAFLDDTRIDQLKKYLADYQVEPSNFEINLDESMFSTRVMPSRLIAMMQKLRSIGFRLGLSHFGEDFSSVRYLKDLPIDTIKLDGDFIAENLKDKKGIEVFKSIVKLAKGFKYTVIACHMHDSKTMVSLSECGVEAATGDFFSPKLALKEYVDYVVRNEQEASGIVSYHLKDNYSADKLYADAAPIGDDIELVAGISKEWGAVSLPGGPCQANYLKFPAGLFDSKGYTFSFWICPRELQNWVSALYVRYQNGFLSFMPNISGGRCMLRIMEDSKVDEWNDLMTSAIPVGKWTFVTCTLDARSSIARIYINGQYESEITDVTLLENPREVWLGSDVFQISFCGKVSAFQMQSSPMEGAEILQLYESFLKEKDFAGNEVFDEQLAAIDIGVHDPAIYEDKDNKKFYIYGTGAEAFESRDLLHWKSLGRVVDKPCKESMDWTGSEAIWAPDIVKVGEEYRLYCSNSSWGVNQSCIFLATSDSPAGPFVPKAPVFKSTGGGMVNAIDANIIEEHGSGRQFMVYGSFWGGIHMIELDVRSGLAKEGEGIGKQIAVRPLWNDGAIEGPYIIYHPGTQYYYLFVSYGSLKSDYNIRVGRSRNVTGPYLDYHGRDMVNTQDEDCSTGLMIACGYRYLTGEAMMGPGHNSVLVRDNGEMYLVCHIRKLAFNMDPGPGILQIRKLIMTEDGWPIALGEPFNSETLLEVRDELLYGQYERIELRPAIPQGIAHAHPMTIFEGGRLEIASVIGKWTKVDSFTLRLEYGPITEYVHYEKGYDKEKNKTTVVMGGLTSQGICTWGKKEDLEY